MQSPSTCARPSAAPRLVRRLLVARRRSPRTPRCKACVTGKASPIRGRYEIRPRRDRTHARRQFRPSNLGVVFCLAGSSTGSIAVRIDQPTTGSSAALRPHHKWKWPVQTFRPRSGTRATTAPRHRHPRDETSASPRSAGACVAAAGAWSGTAASRCFFVHHAGARGSPAFAGRGAPTGTAGAGRDPAAAGGQRHGAHDWGAQAPHGAATSHAHGGPRQRP